MDLRPVLYVTGMVVAVLGVSMTLPMLADLYKHNADWHAFFFCFIVTAFFGGSLILANGGADVQAMKIRQVFLTIFISSLSLCIFAALPFAVSRLQMNYTDAFFEAMSGITTTGATVIGDVAAAPPGILLWRAILQWLGGVAIILVAVAVLPILKVGGMQLFKTETSSNKKMLSSAHQMTSSIVLVYVLLTLVCAIAYGLCGLSTFQSVTHAMTTISTGGFTNSNTSFAAFQSAPAEITAIIFMILAGMPFILFIRTARGGFTAVFRDAQVQAYLFVLAAATLLLAYHLSHTMGEAPVNALRHAAFGIVSIMTGTGYTNTDIKLWGELSVGLLIFLMMVGGCAGSTTSGIKIFRFQAIFSIALVQLKKLIHPNGVFIPIYNGHPIPKDAVISIISFFFVFATCFAVAVIAVCFTGLDLQAALSSVAACLSNTGAAFGEMHSPATNFAAIPGAAKWILSACMLIGRLEFFTVLVMFSPYFWKQ